MYLLIFVKHSQANKFFVDDIVQCTTLYQCPPCFGHLYAIYVLGNVLVLINYISQRKCLHILHYCDFYTLLMCASLTTLSINFWVSV